MNILFHLGAHSTDDGLLIRSILQNRRTLAEAGIVVPGPARYRDLIGETSTRLRGVAADPETEDLLLAAICEDDTAERVVLSNENFLCRGQFVLAADGLYPKVEKAAWLAACYPSHEPEFALAIRNPATLIPDLLKRLDPSGESWPDRIAGVHLGHLRWSDMLARLADAVPDARIVAWCHEDTPFIWSEVIREVTQHDVYTKLTGEFDMAETIMSSAGMARLTRFLGDRDVTNVTQRRRAVAAFLEAHALEEAIEAEIDLPGWTEETVASLTELYEEDIARIRRMPEVRFIEP